MQHHDIRTGIPAALPVRQQLQGVPLELHGVVPGHSPFVFEAQDLTQVEIRTQRPECGFSTLGGNLETPVVSRQELLQYSLRLLHGGCSGEPPFRDQPVLEGSRGTFHPSFGLGRQGEAEMIRMIKSAKVSAVKARTQAVNQMKALVVTAPAELRETLDGLPAVARAARCKDLRPGRLDNPTAAAKYTLWSLARRYGQLSKEIEDLETELERLTRLAAPSLLRIFGVGPDTAAAIMIAAGDNPDRLHSEATFASLCGANPIPASSGKTNRHRLNRGGDRQANAALYRIVLVRLRHDVRTREYMRRRTGDGMSKSEVIRCLKRYVAREVFSVQRTPP